MTNIDVSAVIMAVREFPSVAPPLVPEADRIDDDHQQAALMLLAEDAALAVVLLERLAAAGGLDVEAARAEARAAMAALSANPALRDEMIRDRLR